MFAMETESIERETEILHMTENILYPVIAGVGIIANTLVIAIILIWEKSRTNRTVANMFVVNLALADLLFLIVLPLNMPALIDNGWIFGRFLCTFMEVVKYFNFRASICFLTTLTIDRFFAIVYSLESRAFRTRTNGARLCVVLWLLCFCISIPMIIYTDVRNEEGDLPRCSVHYPGYAATYFSDSMIYEYYNISSSGLGELDPNAFLQGSTYNTTIDADRHLYEDGSANQPLSSFGGEDPHICLDEAHAFSAPKTALVYTNFLLFFLLPIFLIIFCYGGIIRALVQRNISSTRVSGASNRVAVMVALLVSVFLVCWLPFQVFELLILPPGLKVSYVNNCSIMKSVFTMLAWSNSAINPILYSLSTKRFRDKAIISWTYIRYGKIRALALQRSQRTTQTKHTGADVPSKRIIMQSMNRPMSPTTGNTRAIQKLSL